MSGAPTGLAALLGATVHALVEDEHAPAAAGAAIRGPEQAVITAGHHTWPATRRTRPGPAPAPAAEVTPSTLFALGSITKTFTALLLADMVAGGIVGYDDPAHVHLPAHAAPPRGTAITLAGLATHTAGLPHFPLCLRLRALRHWRDPYARLGVQDLHRATARLRPCHDPATRYSTFGMGLLGHLLARAAHLSYADLLTQRVLTPLGLHDTTIPTDDDLSRRAAGGHRHRHPVPHWHLGAFAAAGALYSTTADMLRYLHVQLDPGSAPARLATAIAATHHPPHDHPPHDHPPHDHPPQAPDAMGLGWNVRAVQGHTLLWHSGGTGGFTAFIGFSPGAAAGVVLLANTRPSRPQPVVRAARRLFKAVAFP
ncbi:serine hydrolase [Nonomuraea sp. NPDC050404]|uniref:serine hydrolase domain-containing protein n=1 Tax=Nonomuraea sp. NPDC050404 TaxID=3155783 RepID=UPI0033FC697E